MSFRPSSTLPPVVFDADPAVYHAPQKARRGSPEFVMSRSQLERFAQCPRKWIRGAETESTAAMSWGSLVDCLVLTPQHFEAVYAIAPTTYETTGMMCPVCKSVTDSKKCRTCKTDRIESPVRKDWNLNSETCQEWVKAQQTAGKTITSEGRVSDAWKAIARLNEDEEIKAILDCSKRQVAVNVEWHDDSEIVVPFHCLLDLVPDPKSPFGDTIFDLKTTDSADGAKWAKTVYNWNLAFQAALYLDAMNASAGTKYRNFGHVISEADEPYECTHRLLSAEFLDLGRADYMAALKRYCRCLKSNIWPGFDTDIVEPSAWMVKNPL